MRLNKRKTAKKVKERMDLMARAYRIGRGWEFISIDEVAWKVIIGPHQIGGKFARQVEATLSICIADINAIEPCKARQCFIESYCRFTQWPPLKAEEIAEKVGYSHTQYYHYNSRAICNFAERHQGGELAVWE